MKKEDTRLCRMKNTNFLLAPPASCGVIHRRSYLRYNASIGDFVNYFYS